MTTKKDPISEALDDVCQAAGNLSLHGAMGYDLPSRHMDYTFLKAMERLGEALDVSEDMTHFDPDGLIWGKLGGG